jgi:hypothetical protein
MDRRACTKLGEVRISGKFSAAAADALELAGQELVLLIRGRLGVGVVAVTAITRGRSSVHAVHAVATKATTKPVAAARLGCMRQRCNKNETDNGGNQGGSHLTHRFGQYGRRIIGQDSALKGGIAAP